MTNNNELYHYGVLGMRWGVRRNLRTLANHRRNEQVKSIKNQYRSQQIDKAQKKSGIKKANANKKALMRSVNDKRTMSERRQFSKNVKNQVRSEVSGSGIKRGASSVISGVTKVSSLGALAKAGLATAISPAIAPLAISSAAVTVAASTGANVIGQRILDKVY